MTSIPSTGARVEQRLAGADPRIFEFLNAWRAARGDNLLPKRPDFDPLTIPRLMPCLWMYRYDHEADDFVVRLAGEEINAAWGHSIRGMPLRKVVGEADHPVVLKRWWEILKTPFIQYGAKSERMSALDMKRAERMVTPMTSAEGVPDHILGISLYTISPVDQSKPALEPQDITRIPCSEV